MDEVAVDLTLSKFDVAERQLLLAIKLFFAQEDAVSIHTLSEAASQVLHDIGKKAGVSSLVRDYGRIRPERKKEWLAAVFKSRNFFKHAETDKDEIHTFKQIFNDMSLLDAVNMYSRLKHRWVPETLVFVSWFSLKHPDLMLEAEGEPLLVKLSSGGRAADASNMALFSRAIKMLRDGEVAHQNVALYMGQAEA